MKPSENIALEPSLSREAYWDASFYAREQKAIFWDQWFYVGRSEETEVGQYRVFEVADESIILIRAEDGLHGFLNFCRHRGSRLLCGQGIVRGSIRCPYHAWAYAFDGSLVTSPFVSRDAIPAESRHLHRVGVQEWEGFVFVHVSADGGTAGIESLAAQLGPVPKRLARYPLADLKVARSLRYDVAANWKVMLENYNECYHCAGVHPELCRVVPAFKRYGGADLDWERGIPHRQGAWTFTANGTSDRAAFATLSDDEKVRHKGELIYPNFMLSLAADHVAAFSLWPREPALTAVVCDLLFHPNEIGKPGFDPADVVDFWDLINKQDWQICESVQAGMRSRAFHHGYYAPMEDASLDIRRYIASRGLGS